MERVTEQQGRTYEHHIARYKFVAKYVRDKTVASVACGTGYGENYLATEGGARHVHGMDIDKGAIQSAREHFKRPNLSFACGDVSEIATGSVDVFVCLETIEHIPDDHGFMRQIRRILKPGGTLIISTPNKAFSYKNLWSKKPLNEFHVREYRFLEWKKLLEKYFDKVEFYGQKTILSRALPYIFRYAYNKLKGTLARIEPEDFTIIPYPNDKRFETAYFTAVCR